MLLAISKGLGDKLAATPAVTALVSTRIWFGQPPEAAAFPYLLMTHAAGGSDNETPRDSFDVTMLVKGVATSAASAQAVAEAIRTALHDKDLTLPSPWTAYRCQHTVPVAYVENAERGQYWHAGGLYRVRASQ